MSSEASAILKVYLGASQTGGYRPFGHEERMRVAYANNAETKLAEIQKYLDADHPHSKWSHSELAQEQKEFEKVLTMQFPELDKVAVNALACRWSYSWR
jgi:hypothetical protein